MTTSVVMAVYNQLALTRACLDSLRGTSEEFELCVIDNGSSDGTEQHFTRERHYFPVRYHRNADNVGLIRALNQGAALAAGDVLCFLHNDTEMKDVRWLGPAARGARRPTAWASRGSTARGGCGATAASPAARSSTACKKAPTSR